MIGEDYHQPCAGVRVRNDGRYIAIYCAGCKQVHGVLPLNQLTGHPSWSWNATTLTLSPSVRHFEPATAETQERTTCHYNVTGGRITYHADSGDHTLRGEHEMQEPPASYEAKCMGF